MSLIPAFELGLWNAWILILPLIFAMLAGRIVNRQKFEDTPLNRREKKAARIWALIHIVCLIYPVFLPLRLGTAWFYVGLFIWLLGAIFAVTAEISFATTPVGRPVTKGVYRVSRHPMFFGGFLMFIGIGVACSSWVYLLLAMVWLILNNILVVSEERFCLEKYGKAYREYMNRTARWIGTPRSGKSEGWRSSGEDQPNPLDRI